MEYISLGQKKDRDRNGWMDGWMELISVGQKKERDRNGWMDGWMDGWMELISVGQKKDREDSFYRGGVCSDARCFNVSSVFNRWDVKYMYIYCASNPNGDTEVFYRKN